MGIPSKSLCLVSWVNGLISLKITMSFLLSLFTFFYRVCFYYFLLCAMFIFLVFHNKNKSFFEMFSLLSSRYQKLSHLVWFSSVRSQKAQNLFHSHPPALLLNWTTFYFLFLSRRILLQIKNLYFYFLSLHSLQLTRYFIFYHHRNVVLFSF